MADDTGNGFERQDGDPVEDRVAEWGRRVARLIATAATRAREEAEDIVAEAQSIRRGEGE